MSQSSAGSKNATPTGKSTRVVRHIIRWRKQFSNRIEKLRSSFTKTNVVLWSYRFGFIFIMSALIIALLSLFQIPLGWLASSLAIAAPIVVGVGFVVDAGFIVWQHRQSKWVKGFLGLCGIVAAFISVYLARLFINSATHVDPSHFDLTINILAVAFTLVAWWLLAIPVVMVFAVCSMYLASLMPGIVFSKEWAEKFANLWFVCTITGKRRTPIVHVSKKRETEAIHLAIGRFFGAIILLIAVINVPQYGLTTYAPQIDRTFAFVLAQTGYNQMSDECTNFTPPERVKVLGEGIISVAIPHGQDGYIFEIRKCLPPSSLQ
jgi:hypothetical protein